MHYAALKSIILSSSAGSGPDVALTTDGRSSAAAGIGMSFIVYREASVAAVAAAAVLHQLVEVSSRGQPYYYLNRGRGRR